MSGAHEVGPPVGDRGEQVGLVLRAEERHRGGEEGLGVLDIAADQQCTAAEVVAARAMAARPDVPTRVTASGAVSAVATSGWLAAGVALACPDG